MAAESGNDGTSGEAGDGSTDSGAQTPTTPDKVDAEPVDGPEEDDSDDPSIAEIVTDTPGLDTGLDDISTEAKPSKPKDPLTGCPVTFSVTVVDDVVEPVLRREPYLKVAAEVITGNPAGLSDLEFIWQFDQFETVGKADTHLSYEYVFQSPGRHVVRLSVRKVDSREEFSCADSSEGSSEVVLFVQDNRPPQGGGGSNPPPPPPGCSTNAECDDGLFCNGPESCSSGTCVSGSAPCPGQGCDENSQTCTGCLADGECDDGLFCNGAETCSSGNCVGGSAPCVGQFCDENRDACVECLSDSDCADGLFCNGAETCTNGSCGAGSNACPGRFCNESADLCVDCLVSANCNDGLFCNGTESCIAGTCRSSPPPCGGSFCNEASDACVNCLTNGDCSDGLFCNESTDACVDCFVNADCSDGLYCNGSETCVSGRCVGGSARCSGQLCDEAGDRCVNCFTNGDCSDGLFCDGAERCIGGACFAGTAVCVGQFCDESTDACVNCLTNANCDDGVFCNGSETCVGGNCVAGSVRCAGQLCDETGDACVDCFNDGDCGDGLFCNGDERCSGGTCVSSGSPCLSGEVCNETTDGCDVPQGNVYYVATNGADGNNGSAGAPFRTIQRGLDEARAGDQVVIRPGTYVEQNLTPKYSGVPGLPIVIRGDGADPLDVAIRGLGAAQTRGFTFSEAQSVHQVFDSVTKQGFGYYEFRNFSMTNYIAPFDFDIGTAANNFSEAAHHIVMEDLDLYRNRRGIRGRRGFHDLIARRVHCYDNNLPLMGLSAGGVGANGHDFDNGNAPLMQGGPFNLTFIDCDSYNHDDGGGPGGDADSWIFQAEVSNVTLIRCRAFNNSEDGFDFKCNNVYMNQCAAWNNGASACKLGGAEALDEQAGFNRTHNFTVRNSLFVCNKTGSTSALLLKPHSAGEVTNCTMVSTGLPGSNTPVPVRTLGNSFEPRTFTFRNCIFHQGQQQEVALLIFDNNLMIRDSHNVYFRAPGADTNNVIGARGRYFRTSAINSGGWAAFLASGGFGVVPPAGLQGEQTVAQNPLFTQTADPAGPFTLLPGSPALNTGVNLSSLGNDTLDCEAPFAPLDFDGVPAYWQRAAAGATIDLECTGRPQGGFYDRGANEQ